MAYKGNDLDLRAPFVSSLRDGSGQEEVVGQAGWPPHPDLGRDGPIAVDQTVLACCNAAFDAAAFHGARDVRLEHLLYALTRVDAAREILEQHGVRTSQLRRDTASAIAEAAPGAGQGRAPRTSMEFENILRRAAARAGQDSVPASVHDVMRVLLTYGREAPATALLLRSAHDPQQLERWGAEPATPMLSGLLPSYTPAPPAQSLALQELVGRLDTMEAAMRSLVAEVASDRKTMLDLMGEMQREMRADRAEGHAPVAAVGDRLEEINRSVSGLAERFDAIRAFAPNDAGGDLGGRLSALESKLGDHPAAIADAVSYMLNERHGSGEDAAPPTADAGVASLAAERIATFEGVLRAQTERMEEASKTHERDLAEIFEALVKLGTNQQTLGNNLEAWRLDSSGDISIVSNRLENMERALQQAAAAGAAPLAQPGAPENEGAPGTGLRRWLSGTGRVLPSSWREDAAALRDSLRRADKA
jgi:Clp amino terminal domain, pathogenicity island component